MLTAGIDIGSSATKVVIIDNAQDIVATVISRTEPDQRRLAHIVMDLGLKKASVSLDQIDFIVACGYGRMNVPFADKQVTEIKCHMKGISWLFSDARTVIDVGGQDAKGMKIGGGLVKDFVMNDKCAAGTGRFLEIIAGTLGLKIEDIGPMSLHSKMPIKISSICSIFAEQEVILKLSQGIAVEDVLWGIHESVASRICGMVRRLGIEKDVVLTGGGGKNVGLVKAFEVNLGFPINVPSEPFISGALGAALIAKDYLSRRVGKTKMMTDRRLKAAKFFDVSK